VLGGLNRANSREPVNLPCVGDCVAKAPTAVYRLCLMSSDTFNRKGSDRENAVALSPASRSSDAVPCLICEKPAAPLAQATVLGRHRVQYYRCTSCGFTQTEKPYWLAEAYTTGMSDLDIGPVNRCLECSEMTRALLMTCFNFRASFVDYGAGYGIFVRRMRDLGFDFRAYDKYPSNIFAKGFEAEAGKRYELLTAFEVFEHVPNPIEDLQAMLQFAPNIFLSTQLMPAHMPKPGEWWYYVLGHGQHISLHTHRSLSVLAERCGLRLVSDGNLFHLLTQKPISDFRFRQIIRPHVRVALGATLARVRHVRSLLYDDFMKGLGPLNPDRTG
jgi:hypothetical protein